MSAEVFLELLKENFEKFQDDFNALPDEERDEMRNYFNQVTDSDDLGDTLFDSGNTFDDVNAKISSLSDDDQGKFICAVV